MSAGLLVADLVSAGGARSIVERVALAGDGWTMSYGQLADEARRWQRLLHDSGLRQGDRFAVLANNGPEYLGVLYGASLCGAVAVVLNTRLNADAIRYQLEDSQARLAVIGPDYHDLAAKAGADALPSFVMDEDHRARLRRTDPAPEDWARPDPDGAFIQLYTSGTTGNPKGCVIGQRSWVAAATNTVTGLSLTEQDVHIGAGPFFHVAGLGIAMSVLSVGGRVVFGTTRTLDESWDLVRRHGVTLGSFVGGAGLSAARHEMSATHGRSLRLLLGQAGKHTAAEHHEMGELLPHTDFAGIYGSTESGNFTTRTTRAEEIARPGTVGRPLIGFRASVVDPDDRLVETGQAGELVLRGASVMSEYWGLHDATAETLRGGWLHTGDIMRMDDDGYLYMLDRAKDMVKTGGENVYCIEVENTLRLHPAVRDCAVFGVPDDRWGEGVKAVVVTDEGGDLESLDAWCLERLAGYKRPRWYQFVDALPKQGAKTDKKILRATHDPGQCVRLRERDR